MSTQHGVITLKTVSPVFVGSGDELKKTEYFLDRKAGKAYILDTFKFFRLMVNKNLEKSYEKFILNPEKKSLQNWFFDHREEISFKEILKVCKYSLDISGVDIRKSGIKTFMKDAYGFSYIPGSSLKGAIRTVLLHSMIKSGKLPDTVSSSITQETFAKEARFNRNRFLQTQSKGVEKLLESRIEGEKDAVRKMMSGLRISDSHVIPNEALVLCEKEDYGISGRKAASKIPILRECIKPGTEIKFEFTLDHTKLPFSMNEITAMVSDYFLDYQRLYLNSFQIKKNYQGCILCMGGGAGFISKTLIYSIYPKSQAVKVSRQILNKQFSKHNHWKDDKISPRMRKMTHYQEDVYDMGLCDFSWKAT